MSDRISIVKIQDTMFDLAIVQINAPTSACRPKFEDLEGSTQWSVYWDLH